METCILERIDISDEIFVIDVNGYLGNSTKKEIKYAKEKGKTIRYYSNGEIPSKVFNLIAENDV